MIIGSLLGADALGFYNLAWNLIIQPISRINPVLTRVAFPVFAKLQMDREALKSGYLKMLRLLATTNFAALFGIAAVAPNLVPVVFGERWLPVVPLIQILSLVALIRAVINPVGSLLLSKGRADLGFKWNLALLFSQGLGVVVGSSFGLRGVASALLFLHVAYFFLSYKFLVAPLLGPCWGPYVKTMAPAFCISCTMGLAVWGSLLCLGQANLDPRLLLALGVGGGVAYFIVVSLATRRTEFTEMLGYVGISR